MIRKLLKKKLFALKFGLFKCVIKNQNKLFMHGTALNYNSNSMEFLKWK